VTSVSLRKKKKSFSISPQRTRSLLFVQSLEKILSSGSCSLDRIEGTIKRWTNPKEKLPTRRMVPLDP